MDTTDATIEQPGRDNEDDDEKRKRPWRPVLQGSSQQWWGSQTWQWSSSGWSYNGGWHDQGEHGQKTYTERGKSIVDKNKDERGKDTDDKNESGKWQKYDPVACHNSWENPARGDEPTPGASSSSAAAADRGRMRHIG